MPYDRRTSRNSRKFNILAAGPVVHEPGLMPVRVVLRRHGFNGYVTHKQAIAGSRDHLHHSFAYGVYFVNGTIPPGEHCDEELLARAVANFCLRVSEHTAHKTMSDLSILTGSI